MFSQGKILITRAPSRDAIINSEGVSAPGIANFPCACAVLMTGTDKPGLTRNSAPASRHSVACSERKTVPAPVSTLSPYLRTTSRITAGAFGTVMVISITGIPPAQMASTACRASSKLAALTTGTIPISPIFFNTSSMFIVLSGVLHARKSKFFSERFAAHALPLPAKLPATSPYSYRPEWSSPRRRAPRRTPPPTAVRAPSENHKSSRKRKSLRRPHGPGFPNSRGASPHRIFRCNRRQRPSHSTSQCGRCAKSSRQSRGPGTAELLFPSCA